MTALKVALVSLGVVVLLVCGLGWITFEREAVLPIFPPYLYIVNHPKAGLLRARGGIAHFRPDLGVTVRGYVHGADGSVRSEWDVDNDGVFDCREDNCDHTSTRRSCVSRRVDGRWVAQPEEVTDCGISGERGPVTKEGSETAPP